MSNQEEDYLDFVSEDYPLRGENRTRKLSRKRLPKVKLPPKVRDEAPAEAEEQAA